MFPRTLVEYRDTGDASTIEEAVDAGDWFEKEELEINLDFFKKM